MQEFVKVCLLIFSFLDKAVMNTQALLASDAMGVSLTNRVGRHTPT